MTPTDVKLKIEDALKRSAEMDARRAGSLGGAQRLARGEPDHLLGINRNTHRKKLRALGLKPDGED